MTFIDTHTHLYAEEFNGDRDDVITRAIESGAEKLFLPCIDESSINEIDNLCSKYPTLCYPMLGLHPTELSSAPFEMLSRMEKYLQKPNRYIGIGEVGLDFYWDSSRKEEQLKVFDIQINWALRYSLPLMIHSRSAHDDLVKALMPYKDKGIKGVFHCFSGSKKEATELLDTFPHFMLGIGGIVTFKKSEMPAVLSSVPLGRIVLETDSPYLAPAPNRGKRNETSFLPFVISKLADIYERNADEIARATSKNALSIFTKSISPQ